MNRLNVKTISQNFGNTSPTRFVMGGAYFRLLAAPDTVTIEFFRGGVSVGSAETLLPGLAIEGLPFDEFTVLPQTAGAVQFVVGDAAVKYDRAVGSVSITGTPNVAIASQIPAQCTAANAQKTVTNASTSLVAANAAREYLLIQNNDAAGIVYVNFGAAATAANGVKIPPGGTFELNGNIPTNQVFAIGSIASNANVVVVEG